MANEEPMDEDALQEYLELKHKKYGFLGYTDVNDEEFVWRILRRAEYKEIVQLDVSDCDKEEIICQTCVVYPIDYDFNNCYAGVPQTIAEDILFDSGLVLDENKEPLFKKWLCEYREEMQQFDNKLDCIIAEAFPLLDIKDINNWTWEETMWYFSRAEWILTRLRGMPLGEILSEQQQDNK